MDTWKNLYDMIIVGGGPAGLTAALYGARARLRVLVIEKRDLGGQIVRTDKVENYPGAIGLSGRELAERMHTQAAGAGAEFCFATVTGLQLSDDIKLVKTTKGDYRALSVVLAPGARPRQAGFVGEKEYGGRGVAYCATCDGPLFAGCRIFVLGGGIAAVEEAIFLSHYSSHITLVVREKDYTCPPAISDKLACHANIETWFESELKEVSGNDCIQKAIFFNSRTGKTFSVESKNENPLGVFVFVGNEPETEWLPVEIARNAEGYIITGDNQRTSVPAVYAAGDACVKSLRQVATAVADGAVAATALEPLIEDLHYRKGIPSFVKTKEPKSILSNLGEKAVLRFWKNDSRLSNELSHFLEENEELKQNVHLIVEEGNRANLLKPSLEICHSGGSEGGIHFHCVPKGMEWNAFVLALSRTADSLRKINPELSKQIQGINHSLNLKVMISLTCAHCPASVMAATQIALSNDRIMAEIFDISHFPKLRRRYNLRSVPALIINDEKLIRGRMDAAQMLHAIEKYLADQK